MRKILIINGHPDPESFNRAIALTYGEAAINNGADVQYLHLGDLQFDPNLRWGYRKRMELEPDLVDALDKIHWSEHQVWIHPVWWWSSPAVMKGFLDRVFLPGIVADYSEANEVVGLLGGRTARIIATADTSEEDYAKHFESVSFTQLKKGTLEACGIKPVYITFFGPVAPVDDQQRADWLAEIATLGANEAKDGVYPGALIRSPQSPVDT